MHTLNNPSTTSTSTTRIFKDRAGLEKAYQSALDHGYTADDINVIMLNDTRDKLFAKDARATVIGDKSMDGLALGGAAGGSIVGIASAIAAIGTSLVIPGLGLVVVGPLAAGLVGAGLGSITGGIIGSLVGAGIPEERVKEYEADLKSGGILMVVAPRDSVSREDFEKDLGKF